MEKNVVAIIPARGGSKGIPGKNTKLFCSIPLIGLSILQAVKTSEIDEIYVTSDSDEILNIAKEFGAKTIKRPASISGDTATSESAIKHALGEIGSSQEAVLMLQPTSPLRKPYDLSNAVKQFRDDGLDSGFSGAVLEDFLTWKINDTGTLESVNYDYQNRGRRQDRKPEYVENGSIYIFKPNLILENENRLGGKMGVILNQFWQSFEIDEPDDWGFVEVLYKYYLGE
jgi:CMP-N,N'-diacetyllegionaminic acid synthase